MPLACYIVDFACVQARIVIELDGGQHTVRADQDQIRTATIESAGYIVIRFWNDQVLLDLDSVTENIDQILALRSSDETEDSPLTPPT